MTHQKLHSEGLGRQVSDDRWLYRDATLSFGPGLHAVVGPNGSGKSSLLRDLIGLRPLQHGRVRLGGRELDELPGKERARAIAYLPQQQALPYDRRVYDLVMLGRAPHRTLFGMATREDQKAVGAAMRACEVEAFAERGVLSLSGGERQRVMIARLLATQAAILVLDEPAAALDIGHTLQAYALLRQLADEGRCVIVAMHELDLALRFADQVLLLGRPEIQAGPAAEVLEPQRLSEIFEVDAELVGGDLRFSAKASPEL
jgi:iron complex transport system ATP-binding protein